MNEFWSRYLAGFSTSASQVLKLSDHFNQRLGPTPWRLSGVREAYMAYFFPLNYLRLQWVLEEARRLSFPFSSIVDIGSGPGVAEAVLQDLNFDESYSALEPEASARELHLVWRKALGKENSFLESRSPTTDFFIESRSKLTTDFLRGKTLLLSYVINELEEFPSSWFEAESLIILEPSTRECGRGLMELRAQLIERGFSMWAPCTHQLACPLLVESKNDWCHHRIHVERPDYLRALEAKMQVRNDTLTFSYLLASRVAAPAYSSSTGRIIGDTLYEKGKTRQAFCRGPHREFLAWMGVEAKKMKPWPRGLVFTLPDDMEMKSNELRLKSIQSPTA